MNTYIVSLLSRNGKKAVESLNSNLNSKDLFSKMPSTMSFDVKFDADDGYIFVLSDEKVPLSFFYLKEERFYDLNTVNILNLDRMNFMLSFVKGIGILRRGDPLKYISSEINPLIGSSLFNDPSILEIRQFSDKEMQWQTWKGDLVSITLELPDAKVISVRGREIESKIEELELYPNNNNKIAEIRIHNADFNRYITIRRNGKMRIALWPGEIKMEDLNEKTLFSRFSKRMINLYEYVQQAVGEEL